MLEETGAGVRFGAGVCGVKDDTGETQVEVGVEGIEVDDWRGGEGSAALSTSADFPRGDGLYECFLNQFVVYQTQCCGKERGLPRRHNSDVPHERFGVFLGEVLEELDFHVHDRFVAEEVQA